MPKAYPIYDQSYHQKVDIIRQWVCSVFQPATGGTQRHAPLQTIRTHSMMTAMLAARNIQGANYDCWAVNTDVAEYHE